MSCHYFSLPFWDFHLVFIFFTLQKLSLFKQMVFWFFLVLNVFIFIGRNYNHRRANSPCCTYKFPISTLSQVNFASLLKHLPMSTHQHLALTSFFWVVNYFSIFLKGYYHVQMLQFSRDSERCRCICKRVLPYQRF